MTDKSYPHLFGLDRSNRDFSSARWWGKNQFNSSFPAALCCYMHSLGHKANYLSINEGGFYCGEISITDAFKIDPANNNVFYAFESAHSPFQKYVIGTLPRTDLVVQCNKTGSCLVGLEVKLTALPDNTTCELSEKEYGSEIVIRPDTIVYLACSIAQSMASRNNLSLYTGVSIEDWSEPNLVLPHITQIIADLKKLAVDLEKEQKPFLLQPVWKTKGKSPELADNCLDVFFWSDAAFLYFITDIANNNSMANGITRQTRSAIWLYKMLMDIAKTGHFNHMSIIDKLSYNTKNDKAFASAGNITNRYMRSPRLENPLVTKTEIKKIILGGGQNLLSPERRFDAIIFNSPELFS